MTTGKDGISQANVPAQCGYFAGGESRRTCETDTSQATDWLSATMLPQRWAFVNACAMVSAAIPGLIATDAASVTVTVLP